MEARFRSIRTKLVVPLAAFMIAAAVFSSTYFPSRQTGLINDQFRQRLSQAVMTLTVGTSISVISGSARGAVATADVIMSDEDLSFLLVLDPEGSALISRGDLDEAEIGLDMLIDLPLGEFEEIGQHLVLRDGMEFEGELLGTAIVGLKTAERERAIFHNVAITLLLCAGLTALSIGVVVYLTKTVIVSPIHESVRIAEQMAGGDLTGEIETTNRDEIGRLLDAINEMSSNLNSLIGQTQRSGVRITSSATQISASAKELEAMANEQVASTHEVVSTANEISATSRDLVNAMGGVSRMAEDTVSSADAGRQGLSRMEESMEQMEAGTGSIADKLAIINEKASSISTVVVTITKVADQTNLLSLNAAIEAEKAGEFGRGFAVVAREIRRLADQTAVATLDIEQTVEEMRSAVSSGVMSMDKFSQEIRLGSDVVRTVGSQVNGIIEQVHTLKPHFETVEQGIEAQSIGRQLFWQAPWVEQRSHDELGWVACRTPGRAGRLLGLDAPYP